MGKLEFTLFKIFQGCKRFKIYTFGENRIVFCDGTNSMETIYIFERNFECVTLFQKLPIKKFVKIFKKVPKIFK